jgi:hypothetical protein
MRSGIGRKCRNAGQWSTERLNIVNWPVTGTWVLGYGDSFMKSRH